MIGRTEVGKNVRKVRKNALEIYPICIPHESEKEIRTLQFFTKIKVDNGQA